MANMGSAGVVKRATRIVRKAKLAQNQTKYNSSNKIIGFDLREP